MHAMASTMRTIDAAAGVTGVVDAYKMLHPRVAPYGGTYNVSDMQSALRPADIHDRGNGTSGDRTHLRFEVEVAALPTQPPSQ